jgi:hypothetical protein
MIYVFLKAFRDFGGDVAAFPSPWVLPFAGKQSSWCGRVDFN